MLREIVSAASTKRDSPNEYELGEAIQARVMARYTEIKILDRKPIIMDAGANMGATAIWFRKKFPEAAIVVVEPDPENLRVLRLNVEGLEEIIVIPAAIGSCEGLVRIEHYGQGWSTRTKRNESGVPVITMADAFAIVKDGVPFITKIDIDGFESDLFAQNTDWLDEVYVVAIEPHDWVWPGANQPRLPDCHGRLDFEIFISGENLVYVRV